MPPDRSRDLQISQCFSLTYYLPRPSGGSSLRKPYVENQVSNQ
jgi:hypothetical protein